MAHAKDFSKKSRCTDDGTGGAPDGDVTEDDDLDELVDISSSEEDDESGSDHQSCESLSGYSLSSAPNKLIYYEQPSVCTSMSDTCYARSNLPIPYNHSFSPCRHHLNLSLA